MKTPREVIADHLFDTDRWNLLVEAAAFGDGILEALDSAGYQIVPKEPTAEMIDAASLVRDDMESAKFNTLATWNAMLAAAAECHHPDNSPLDELPLSVRAANCLKNGGYITAGQARAATDAQLLGIDNLGRKSLWEIRAALGQESLPFPHPRQIGRAWKISGTKRSAGIFRDRNETRDAFRIMADRYGVSASCVNQLYRKAAHRLDCCLRAARWMSPEDSVER